MVVDSQMILNHNLNLREYVSLREMLAFKKIAYSSYAIPLVGLTKMQVY